MPWQSVYNFKGGSSKRKEQSPASNSEASSSGDLHALQAQAAPAGSNFAVTEQPPHPQLNFAPDAWPTRYVFDLKQYKRSRETSELRAKSC